MRRITQPYHVAVAIALLVAAAVAQGASIARPPSMELAERTYYDVARATLKGVDDGGATLVIDELLRGDFAAATVTLPLDDATATRIAGAVGEPFLVVFSDQVEKRFPINKTLVDRPPYLVRFTMTGEALFQLDERAEDLLFGRVIDESLEPRAYVPIMMETLVASDPALQRLAGAELYAIPEVRAEANRSFPRQLSSFVLNSDIDPAARRIVLGIGEGPIPEIWALKASARLVREAPVTMGRTSHTASLVLAAFDTIGRAEARPSLQMEDLMRWMTGSHLAAAERAIALAFELDPAAAREALTRELDNPAVPEPVRRSMRQRLS